MRTRLLLLASILGSTFAGSANIASATSCEEWKAGVAKLAGQALEMKCISGEEFGQAINLLALVSQNACTNAKIDENRPDEMTAGLTQRIAACPTATASNVRTVSENTDLYDAREGAKIGGEGDFLAMGQQVTTVGQCGNDWCELSSPKGWVWGGHLK